jgi:hypothetical protein
MHEQIGMPFRDAFEEEARPYLVAFQPFVPPHFQSDQRFVEVLEEDTDTLVSERDRRYDGLHFSKSGQETFAARWVEILTR